MGHTSHALFPPSLPQDSDDEEGDEYDPEMGGSPPSDDHDIVDEEEEEEGGEGAGPSHKKPRLDPPLEDES